LVVDAQDKLEALKQDLLETESPDRQSEIRKQIAEQEAILQSAKKSGIDIAAEIAEARKIADMNEFERMVYKYQKETELLEEVKAARILQLADELKALEDLKGQEKLLYETQKDKLLDIWDILTKVYESNMKARLDATENFVNKSIELYQKLADAAEAAQARGANLSTGAIKAISKFDDIQLGEGGGTTESTTNNITNEFIINANIDSQIDIDNLAQQLSDILKEQINQ